jgi:hypothetical protein
VLIEARIRPTTAVTEGSGFECRELAGDDLVPHADGVATRIVEIAAPAAAVWPWLAQLMRGAGIYGWQLLEMPGCRSADYLVEGLPEPHPGDRVADLLELALIDDSHEIVWRSLPEVALLNHAVSALTIDYLLEAIDPSRSRLIARVRAATPQLTQPIRCHLMHVLVSVLVEPQLATLKRCIESYRARLVRGDINRGAVRRHQAAPFRPAGAWQRSAR